MTPGELSLWYRQRRREEIDRQKLAEANIYTLAALIRAAVWGKKMPDFETVFGRTPEGRKEQKKKEMSDEEMYEQVRLLNKLFGGTEQ